MWFFISLVFLVLIAVGTVWLRNKWVIDSFNSYGVYGTMAGLYLYRKFGLWHIGTPQAETEKSSDTDKVPHSLSNNQLDLKPGYIPNR